jgi:small conductance mechanosensitive channel
MNTETLNHWTLIAQQYAADFGTKILGAIAFWVIGRWLISFALRLLRVAMDKQKFDPTLLRYLANIISGTLNLVLIIGILGFFGVQTASFAALIAAAGVAIGMAWSGLLANFAAGAFLMVLRPFKVGDFVSVGGITGTVKEIGLFATAIDTPDNVLTMIGNNKIFGDTIQNFSANAYRRVELKCQLAGNADHKAAVALFKQELAKIPNVLSTPAPDVEILDFNLIGPVLAIRPYCHNKDYWQVYFDTTRVIHEAPAAAGFPAPKSSHTVLMQNAA